MQDLGGTHKIQKLVRTIARIIRESGEDWVSWRRVAREQEGSEAFDVELSALAEHPAYRHYFHTYRNRVKLSEAGWDMVNKPLEEPPLPFAESIAEAVINYASKLRPLFVNVERIVAIARASHHFVYAVQVSSTDTAIPSETPITFYPKAGSAFYGSRFSGKIVGQEADGLLLYVAFEVQVPPASLPAYLTIDRGYLLHQLGIQLANLTDISPLVEQIITPDDSAKFSLGHDNSEVIADYLVVLEPLWTRFLWGPPGAGKTFALGRLIVQLLRDYPNERILLVAPSNRAVDVAAEQLLNQIQRSELRLFLEQRQILRFGYPRKTEVLKHPELLGPVSLDTLTEKIRDLSAKIESAEQQHLSEEKIALLKAERLEHQEAVKEAVREHVKQSRVVLTTTTLAYMQGSPILEVDWDTVLVDEVTMVAPATCIFLGSLAHKRLLLAGDPRQLGPVYEENRSATANTYQWMGRDIFEVSQLSKVNGESREIALKDSRLVRITSQRRCATPIWNQVKHLYPEVRNKVSRQTIKSWADLSPLSGKAFTLLDISGSARSFTCKREHHSWKNQYTASLAVSLAGKMLNEAKTDLSIAIIAPYRAQVKELRQLIKQERQDDSRYDCVEAGTVHQFQGSDADVVIFDLVDGPRRSKPGKLLCGETGNRLVNVAITRARGKVVLIANRTWCLQSNFNREDNPLLWDLIVNRLDNERVLPSFLGSYKETVPLIAEPKKQEQPEQQQPPPNTRQENDKSRTDSSKQQLVQEIMGQPKAARKLSGIDLAGAELAKAYFYQADLSKANLSKANLQGANLGGANLKETNLQEAFLTGVNWRDADLTKADLRGAYLGDVKFFRVTLQGVNFAEASMQKARLAGGQFAGASLRKTDLSGADLSRADLTSADLADANLRNANLNGCNLHGANLSGTDLRGADLRQAKIDETTNLGEGEARVKIDDKTQLPENWRVARSVTPEKDKQGKREPRPVQSEPDTGETSRPVIDERNLSGADLSDRDLSKANLARVDLSGATLRSTNLSQANLGDATLRNALMRNAILCDAFLRNADLYGAYLDGANLRGADLRYASLREAFLRGTDLRGADLRGADLRGVHHLSEAELRGARYNGQTKWPEGFKPLLGELDFEF